MKPYKKVLIANRGEIACRIIRTLKKLGMRSVVIYSEADVDSDHVQKADESYLIGGAAVSESYLKSNVILELAKECGCDAIHPGYGLLSENTAFAKACEESGIDFIGPQPIHIETFSLKHTARALAISNNVPVLPGSSLLDESVNIDEEAARIGYPLMIKSTAGGGGIGMSLCSQPGELSRMLQEVAHLSQANFKDSSVYLERFVEKARHVEVQIFGDGHGQVLSLGLRDCSMQRRNQKVIEETPPEGIDEEICRQMTEAACRLAAAANYRSAGTVEFLYDVDRKEFYFLEVNTRLQVEHGVTEEVTGIDIVEWMIRLQSDSEFKLPSAIPETKGHSIQVRIYAEDPSRDFQPSVGTLSVVSHPSGVRCDSWVFSGTEVSAHYDPLLTKVIVHADDRESAIAKMKQALAQCVLEGIETNLEYLQQLIRTPEFSESLMTTGFLRTFIYKPEAIEVRKAGTMTTVQDYPARIGYWSVGIPPSGPMDNLHFQLANKLVGNDDSEAGLEFTNDGPTLVFHRPAIIALAGARMNVQIDGTSCPFNEAIHIPAGSVVKTGKIIGAGMRTYMAIRGGIQVTPYLGSRSTFTLGQFGGHAGRALKAGDMVHFKPAEKSALTEWPCENPIPEIDNLETVWEIAVLYGPHGAPDFFSEADIEMILATEWEVHYNSARTGIRLIGPKPEWARPDGGEAGLHPSNIHDNAYAVGAVDFTGDMPVILGVDGPSLGGFVCPFTVIQADLWKLGQLRPGYKLKFIPVSDLAARQLDNLRRTQLGDFRIQTDIHKNSDEYTDYLPTSTILKECTNLELDNDVIIRRSGESHILIEFGKLELDLKYRLQAQLFYERIKETGIRGITDMTPGIRSLQVQFDTLQISSKDLITEIEECVREIKLSEDIRVPSRIVHLPLSWNDPSIQKAIDIYQQSVRPDAPWYPSNIEFIRRINGLKSEEEVRNIIFQARYLVMGLGDVYLGAPVAVPVDPRHRLVTTKYNPARTWTPENAVGIGGTYMCVYGMEGPGGYQLFGRTLQMWNRYRETNQFKKGYPWLLRFFDQIQFHPVSPDELVSIRRDFIHGLYPLKIEDTEFSWLDYRNFLVENQTSIKDFKDRQHTAFEEEKERWRLSGQNTSSFIAEAEDQRDRPVEIPDGCEAVESMLSGTVWKILIKPGDSITADTPILILEAMKMEVPVYPVESGTVHEILVSEGQSVSNGQILALINV